jgi:hypothetical protein
MTASDYVLELNLNETHFNCTILKQSGIIICNSFVVNHAQIFLELILMLK